MNETTRDLLKLFRGQCNEVHGLCLKIEKHARDLRKHTLFQIEERVGQHDDTKEELQIAIRHIEDARARIERASKRAGESFL